jgi:hypothetical protein
VIDSAITIEGNSATIERDTADTDVFCLLAVSNTGDLTLNHVTLSGGYGTGTVVYVGGAVHNNGKLAIANSTLSDNTAAAKGGGVYNNGGTVIITYSTLTPSYYLCC